MFFLAHLALGLIIGKISGHYWIALIGSLAIDIDHIIPYVRHGVIFNWKKFWKTVTSADDPYGNQRNYLHSLFTWFILSAIAFLINSSVETVFSIAYLSHLVLDALDNSDFYPLYPLRFNVRGPIVYFSRAEWIITLLLFLIYFII